MVSIARKKIPKRAVEFVPPGLVLHEGEAPELFALLRRVVERSALRHSVAVCVDWSGSTSSIEQKSSIPPRSRRVFRIGLPLMAVVSREQLEILLTCGQRWFRSP